MPARQRGRGGSAAAARREGLCERAGSIAAAAVCSRTATWPSTTAGCPRSRCRSRPWARTPCRSCMPVARGGGGGKEGAPHGARAERRRKARASAARHTDTPCTCTRCSAPAPSTTPRSLHTPGPPARWSGTACTWSTRGICRTRSAPGSGTSPGTAEPTNRSRRGGCTSRARGRRRGRRARRRGRSSTARRRSVKRAARGRAAPRASLRRGVGRVRSRRPPRRPSARRRGWCMHRRRNRSRNRQIVPYLL